MTDKPSYLGLLNGIANAEAQAECYLDAWVATTQRDDVRQVIATVALREGEHGKAFAKRICELGFSVVAKPNPRQAEVMAVASSTELCDREKFERLGLGRPVDSDKPDIFTGMFADTTIDIQTGMLLGRYIAEERDSGRMLRGCYEALCAEETAGCDVVSGSPGGQLEARLSSIEMQLAALVAAITPAVESVPSGASRGNKSAKK